MRRPNSGVSLQVDELTLFFGGVKALDRLSFRVHEGGLCGLIGPNGAGKTTLFNVVSRLYEPTGGSIEFRGNDLLAVPVHGVAEVGIARTFQNLAVFPSMTLIENVMVGAHSKGKIGVLGAVTRVGAAAENKRMRDFAGDLLVELGLGHLAHRRAEGLPFGTLKRLELARALAASPHLLLLDEPAAGLTHSEVDDLADTIVRTRRTFALTMLLVEHHMQLVMGISDQVVVMSFGRCIKDGTPAEVQTDPQVIEAYLGAAP